MIEALQFLWEYWPMLLPGYLLVGLIISILFCYGDGTPVETEATNTVIALWCWPAIVVFFLAYGVAHFFHHLFVVRIVNKLMETAEDDPS